jgi:phosphosulfolactate phosphohydrolase-like enzyme
MKYALIKNNKVELISYQQTEGYVEVEDNVYADMIKKPDGSFNYSDEFLAEQEQFRIAEQNKKETELANKQSALNKLKALGLNDAEINSILGK